MKICWDNLEGFKLTSTGNFKKGSNTYIEKGSCKKCGESYLTLKTKPIDYCGKSCGMSGKNHYLYGKVLSKEHKKKLSKALKGENNPMWAKHHTNESKRKMSESKRGNKSYTWKGGITKKGLPLYDTYAHRLWCDEVAYEYIEGLKILKVGCVNCGKMFIPKIYSVAHRVRYLEGKISLENRFYCSDKCRVLCPIFGQHKYPKGYKSDFEYTKEEYLIWRKEVMTRANYKCEYCAKRAVDAHHIRPKALEPFFALDPDYGLACCEKCHYKYAHKNECKTALISNVICLQER